MIERAPPLWPHTDHAVVLSVDHVEHTAIKSRIDAAYEAMAADLGISMYGDHEPERRWSLRDTFIKYKWRAQAAWEVLLGRADIC